MRCYVLPWHAMVWHAMAWPGMPWHRGAQHAMAWQGPQDMASHAIACPVYVFVHLMQIIFVFTLLIGASHATVKAVYFHLHLMPL